MIIMYGIEKPSNITGTYYEKINNKIIKVNSKISDQVFSIEIDNSSINTNDNNNIFLKEHILSKKIEKKNFKSFF